MKKTVVHYPYQNLNTRILQKGLGVEVWAELRFHHKRMWRFDYAVPEWKIAVEQDGGLYNGGRHSGGDGQLHDMEKMNEAAMLGWVVLHYTPAQFRHLTKVINDIKRVHEAHSTLDSNNNGSVHQGTQRADDSSSDKTAGNTRTKK